MIIIFLFLIGLFVGSFLGVLIDRIPEGKSFIRGRSFCDKCHKNLKWYDLIPVISYVLLRGKCRFCKTKLTLFYPIIEFITATLFALTFYFSFNALTIFNIKFVFYLAYLLTMVSSFIVITFIDLKKGIIPDGILIFDIVITVIWLLTNPLSVIFNHLISGLGSLMFFVGISYIFYMVTKKDGMGGGDIKLSFVLGLFLGFPFIVVSLYLAFLTGALISTILIVWRKKIRKDSIPFGPFLILGVFLSLFWGNHLYSFFLKLLGA